MARAIVFLTCLLLSSAVLSEDVPSTPDELSKDISSTQVELSEDVPSTPSFNEKFTTSLMKILAKDTGGNLIFSPLSIETALAITSLGARGNTMNQIYEAFGYPVDQAKHILSEKQKLLTREQSPGAIWKTANRIMTDMQYPLLEEYVAEVNNAFPGVVVDNEDFHKASSIVGKVNSWVAESTNNVITELLRINDLNDRVKMIILNAIYFKGEWLHGFHKLLTNQRCFYSEPGQCTKTDMMHITQFFKYRYDADLLSKMIELPYKNTNFSMIVVLPDETHSNLTHVMDNLDVDKIIKNVDAIKVSKVKVSFPKFEIESSANMKETLMKMGIQLLFNEAADLTGLAKGRLYVDEVIHKARISCDEEGTVAAATTGITLLGRSFTHEPQMNYFTADHPFFYLLRDKNTGVLFAGQKVSV